MSLVAILTGTTCGDGCWHAREDICRCSCGGKNHGCLRTADGEQPIRTCKIDGDMHELKGVGDVDEEAWRINQAAGITYRYAASARQHWGEVPPAKIRMATAAQVEKWPELTAYRGQRQRPYLLWVVRK